MWKLLRFKLPIVVPTKKNMNLSISINMECVCDHSYSFVQFGSIRNCSKPIMMRKYTKIILSHSMQNIQYTNSNRKKNLTKYLFGLNR